MNDDTVPDGGMAMGFDGGRTPSKGLKALSRIAFSFFIFYIVVISQEPLHAIRHLSAPACRKMQCLIDSAVSFFPACNNNAISDRYIHGN